MPPAQHSVSSQGAHSPLLRTFSPTTQSGAHSVSRSALQATTAISLSAHSVQSTPVSVPRGQKRPAGHGSHWQMISALASSNNGNTMNAIN
eukprot:2153369-Rhodomonas_salina.2